MNKPKCKIDARGHKRWYLNDKQHRENGPAIELVNGKKHWYLYGKPVAKEEYKKYTLIKKLAGL